MKAGHLIQLKDGEEVLEIVHESLIPWIPKFVFVLLFLALPFFLLFPLFREGMVGIGIFFVLLALASVLLFRTFVLWSRTLLLITDKRVIDHDQAGLFSWVLSEARFHQVDEVSYQIKGFWATIFRYGSLRIHMHGNAADIEFCHIAYPARIADLLNDLRENEET